MSSSKAHQFMESPLVAWVSFIVRVEWEGRFVGVYVFNSTAISLKSPAIYKLFECGPWVSAGVCRRVILAQCHGLHGSGSISGHIASSALCRLFSFLTRSTFGGTATTHRILKMYTSVIGTHKQSETKFCPFAQTTHYTHAQSMHRKEHVRSQCVGT